MRHHSQLKIALNVHPCGNLNCVTGMLPFNVCTALCPGFVMCGVGVNWYLVPLSRGPGHGTETG